MCQLINGAFLTALVTDSKIVVTNIYQNSSFKTDLQWGKM